MKGTGASDAHKIEDIGTFATDFFKNMKFGFVIGRRAFLKKVEVQKRSK